MSDADFFLKTIVGYRAAKVVLVGSRLGVFSALAEGPARGHELARDLDCSSAALENLLRALTALGLLENVEGEYRNAALADRHLVPGRPAYFGHILGMHDMLWDAWSNLENVVRTGSPARGLPSLLEDVEFRDEYIRGVHAFSQQAAGEVAAILGEDNPTRMLDVGGGGGTYTLELLRLVPACRATILDLPSTLEVTKKIVAESPDSDRVTLHPGDYLRSRFSAEYDLVLMSHVTHDEHPDNVRTMLQMAFEALRSGGVLAIHDWVVDEYGTQPLAAALFSVNVMVYTQGGRVYSEREYEEFASAAGFGPLSRRIVEPAGVPNPTWLLLAAKR